MPLRRAPCVFLPLVVKRKVAELVLRLRRTPKRPHLADGQRWRALLPVGPGNADGPRRTRVTDVAALSNWREPTGKDGELAPLSGVKVSADGAKLKLEGIELDDDVPIRFLVADVKGK